VAAVQIGCWLLAGLVGPVALQDILLFPITFPGELILPYFASSGIHNIPLLAFILMPVISWIFYTALVGFLVNLFRQR